MHNTFIIGLSLSKSMNINIRFLMLEETILKTEPICNNPCNELSLQFFIYK